MPYGDINANALFSRKPNGGVEMTDKDKCKCGCEPYPQWQHCPVPPPYPPYPEYPYCPPVCPSVGSIEAQIAKLSKKSAAIRKQLDNLINKNKSIVITIGNVKYNFGCYLNEEGETTSYAEKIEEILTAELEAIKTKITELASELEVSDENDSDVVGP